MISCNVQSGCSTGGGGGGISIVGAGAVQVLDNVIEDNVLTASGGGGGIYINGGGSNMIYQNTVRNNSVSGTTGTEGGGIRVINQSTATFFQNLVVGNSSSVRGGGISLSTNGIGLFLDNTIADNTAPEGSAIYVSQFHPDSMIVNNNIVAVPGQSALYCSSSNSPPSFIHNNIFSDGGVAYGGACSDETGLNGNISENPKFVDTSSGDYTLQPSSSLVDAGDSFTGSVPETDLDGLPRLFDGTGNGAAEIDIGAFEFQANPVAHAGDNQTVLDSETVTLDGTLSFDPDGRTLTYRWTLDGAEIATAATANVGPFEVGTYTIALTVTDGDGDSTSHSVVLTVLPSNLPPVADAGPAQNVRVTQTATLDGTGTSDPEGGPLTYSWSLGEVEIATGAMPTVGPFAEGSHLITLTVTDEEGLTES